MHPPFVMLLSLVLGCVPMGHARAEIVYDKTVEVRSAIPVIEPLIKAYASSRAKGMFRNNIWVFDGEDDIENSLFAWRISGKTYLSAVARYTPNVDPVPGCERNCDWIVNGHMVCHLFMFDAVTLALVDVVPLDVVRDPSLLVGKPRCYSVKAMAVGGGRRDMLVVTLGYVDSAEPAEGRYDPPQFVTSVAVHIDQTQGSLRMERRDDCLGNPNSLMTVAAARLRLRKCEAGKLRPNGNWSPG